ncbi:hypothetical protein HDU76_007298, partial [Blyttiomyces sp. JEL0837]
MDKLPPPYDAQPLNAPTSQPSTAQPGYAAFNPSPGQPPMTHVNVVHVLEPLQSSPFSPTQPQSHFINIPMEDNLHRHSGISTTGEYSNMQQSSEIVVPQWQELPLRVKDIIATECFRLPVGTREAVNDGDEN